MQLALPLNDVLYLYLHWPDHFAPSERRVLPSVASRVMATRPSHEGPTSPREKTVAIPNTGWLEA